MCYLPILGSTEEITSPAIEYWCEYFQELGHDCTRIPAPPAENAPLSEWEKWYALIVPLLRTTLKTMVDIPNTPGQIQFAPDNQTMLYEANENEGVYSMFVERVGGSDGEITVKYGVTDGSAKAGRDFEVTTGSFTWGDRDNSQKTFTVQMTDDSEVENDETFDLVLIDVTNGDILATQTVTIVSDDVEKSPGIIQFARNNYEVTENDNQLILKVKRLTGYTGQVTVSYFTSDGTAMVGHDFEPISGTLTWEDGENEDKSLTIIPIDDDEVENDETFTVNLSDITGGASLGTAITLVTLHSDDQEVLPGIIRFAQDHYQVNEKEGKLILTIKRVGGSDGEVTVRYMTNNGTALAVHDFHNLTNTLTWEDGASDDKTVTLTVIDDDEVEPVETLSMTLQEISGDASIGGERITITIVSDDQVESPTSTATNTPPPPTPNDQTNGATTTTPNTTNPSLPQPPNDQSNGTTTATGSNTNTQPPDEQTNGATTATNTNISTPQPPPNNTPTGQVDKDEKDGSVLIVDEVGTPTTNPSTGEIVCISQPEYALQPTTLDFSVNLGDEAISQTFTGGIGKVKLIQPPNGQIVTLLDYLFPNPGGATIQIEAREVGTTQLIIGDECGNQATVNMTVKPQEVVDEGETPLKTCPSDPAFPLKPEKTEMTMKIGESRVLWFTGGQPKRWLSKPPAGELVRLESTDFPTEGGAKLMLTATQPGETQLGISDCLGESLVKITVTEQIFSCTPLPTEPQNVSLLAGEATLFKTLTGDQVRIIAPYDDTVITLELPIFSKDGITQLKLTPRQAGTTQIVLGNCNGEAKLDVTVLKPGTLAHACQLAGKTDGFCEQVEATQLLELNSLGIDHRGEPVATSAHFDTQFSITPTSENLVIGATDEIAADLTIVADEAHIGLAAEILLVVARKTNEPSPAFFMYDGTRWQPWLASDLSRLVAAKKYARLPAIAQISPDFKRLEQSPGEFTVYIGYRLENGTLIFNGKNQLQFWSANSESVSLGAQANIRAYFSGEVQTETSNNMLTVTMRIKPDIKHLGAKADIIIVGLYAPAHEDKIFGYMQLPGQAWHSWQGEIEHLVGAYQDQTLKENMAVTIFEGELNLPPGQVTFYVGYRLYPVSAHTIVFNGKEPIILHSLRIKSNGTINFYNAK